jgi:hypothetical protein
MASSRNIRKNKIKQPRETNFTTEANSSNLERANQCWYNPAKANIISQYIYTAAKGIRYDVGVV